MSGEGWIALVAILALLTIALWCFERGARRTTNVRFYLGEPPHEHEWVTTTTGRGFVEWQRCSCGETRMWK